jgi:diphosphomevalonate decarboxylase
MKEKTKSQSKLNAAAGEVCWRSPSNIAIIKYWGKHEEQLPDNPSVSLTLENAYTQTHVDFQTTNSDGGLIDFTFQGERNDAFSTRIESYIKRIAQDYPVLNELTLRIASENSFPHSTGIASSASAMSAIALCLGSIIGLKDDEFMQRVSHFARLGSGSASRSVYAPIALWGRTQLVPGSSDEHAVPFQADPVFHTMHDAILIVDASPKAVSSSKGHALMRGHAYAGARKAQAMKHLEEALSAMKKGDLATLGVVVEAEALALHAMMMTSHPSYLLMRGATTEIIHAVRAFREVHDVPVYFTLDAGPNVHLLYPEAYASQVERWINSDLLGYCTGQKVIFDRVGRGPERLA